MNTCFGKTVYKAAYTWALKSIEIADKKRIRKSVGKNSFLYFEEVNHRETNKKSQEEHKKSKYDHP